MPKLLLAPLRAQGQIDLAFRGVDCFLIVHGSVKLI